MTDEIPKKVTKSPIAMRKKVVALRHDNAILTDCWIDTTSEGNVLVIRQVKFEEDGMCGFVNKQFRLDESEQALLMELLLESAKMSSETKGNR